MYNNQPQQQQQHQQEQVLNQETPGYSIQQQHHPYLNPPPPPQQQLVPPLMMRSHAHTLSASVLQNPHQQHNGLDVSFSDSDVMDHQYLSNEWHSVHFLVSKWWITNLLMYNWVPGIHFDWVFFVYKMTLSFLLVILVLGRSIPPVDSHSRSLWEIWFPVNWFGQFK